MTNQNKGYIGISRAFFNHPFWIENRSFSKAEAWIDLIQTARYYETPEKVLVGMEYININRGELRASQRYLAKRWSWSLGKINRYINFLKNESMIDTRMERGETIIKILNYNNFNPSTKNRNEHLSEHGLEQSLNTNENNNGTPMRTPLEQTKERKESKQRKREGNQRFTPPSLNDIQKYFSIKVNEKGLNINPTQEAEKFESFYSSKGWYVGKNKMKDWKKSITGWITRLETDQPNGKHQTQLVQTSKGMKR